jgi:hypothetical protein
MVFAASGWRTSWHRGEPENAVPCLGMTTIYQEIAVAVVVAICAFMAFKLFVFVFVFKIIGLL